MTSKRYVDMVQTILNHDGSYAPFHLVAEMGELSEQLYKREKGQLETELADVYNILHVVALKHGITPLKLRNLAKAKFLAVENTKECRFFSHFKEPIHVHKCSKNTYCGYGKREAHNCPDFLPVTDRKEVKD